jgi:hypothetical protein
MKTSVRTATDTLSELWKVKDATAHRFRAAAEYFSYLSQAEPKQSIAKRAKSKRPAPATKLLPTLIHRKTAAA